MNRMKSLFYIAGMAQYEEGYATLKKPSAISLLQHIAEYVFLWVFVCARLDCFSNMQLGSPVPFPL